LDHPALNEFLHACSARLVRDDFFDDAKVLWYSMVLSGVVYLMLFFIWFDIVVGDEFVFLLCVVDFFYLKNELFSIFI
jgi:hypothetical protein